jgi:hypothetical protein
VDEAIPVILVIEDDEAIQSVVEDALTEGGFEPAIAPSGEEAGRGSISVGPIGFNLAQSHSSTRCPL